MSEPTAGQLRRTIGLPGAVFTLVGYVIGASIFILPGQLAGTAGPAVVVSYLLASVPALFACVISAQLGSAFPVSGASYVAVSRILAPFWGFFLVWLFMSMIVVGVALVAYGFADYLAFFLPRLDRRAMAVAVVGAFMLTNVLGARLAVWAQGVMVVGFIAALLVVGLGGLAHLDRGLLVPFFPVGLGPVLAAAVPAYYSYSGFNAIIELGGEIKRPSRTIPLTLAISFVCVLVLYTLIPLVLPGLISWRQLGTAEAPLAIAAATFLPRSAAALISLGALLAAATSINAILLAQSRDIFVLARDRILPHGLAHLSPTLRSPDRAVIAVGLLSIGGVLIGATITQYAILTVVGFMVLQMITALSVILLPHRRPSNFTRAEFKLGAASRVFFAGGLAILSLAFLGIAVHSSPGSTLVFLAFVALGGIYYLWRKHVLERAGYHLETLLDTGGESDG